MRLSRTIILALLLTVGSGLSLADDYGSEQGTERAARRPPPAPPSALIPASAGAIDAINAAGTAGPTRVLSGRVALVIGNGAYRDVGPLANPPNDARAIAAALRRLNFQVIEGVNLDRNGLFTKLDELTRAIETGVDLGLVFYAGHGVQIEGRNYLLPVDILQDRDPRRDAIPVDDILGTLDGVRRLKLVILDACRNNPLRSVKIGSRALGVHSGLVAPAEVAGDTLIAYATKADDTAADGAGTNSPYTTALLAHLETPGLALERLFGKVRDSVMESTRNRQQPFTYGSLGGEPVYLKMAPAPTATPEPMRAAPMMIATDPVAVELTFWSSIQASRNASDFDAYLEKFPSGTFASLARNRLSELRSAPMPTPAPRPLASPVPPPIPAAPPTPVPVPAPQQSAALLSQPGTAKFMTPGGAAPALGLAPQPGAVVPGTVFKDCGECPELVTLPRGTFTMGSPISERERSRNESPQHTVTIGYDLAVGKYELTFAEWDACVAQGGCGGYRPADMGWGRGRRPVINVS